jgi:hypothetical protein
LVYRNPLIIILFYGWCEFEVLAVSSAPVSLTRLPWLEDWRQTGFDFVLDFFSKIQQSRQLPLTSP